MSGRMDGVRVGWMSGLIKVKILYFFCMETFTNDKMVGILGGRRYRCMNGWIDI